MPLGTEYSFGAGDIRAAAALMDAMELPDDEQVEFLFDDVTAVYRIVHPYSDVDWFVLEDYAGRADEVGAQVEVAPVCEAGGWLIFDEDPYAGRAR